jgi:hypothetical protein
MRLLENVRFLNEMQNINYQPLSKKRQQFSWIQWVLTFPFTCYVLLDIAVLSIGYCLNFQYDNSTAEYWYFRTAPIWAWPFSLPFTVAWNFRRFMDVTKWVNQHSIFVGFSLCLCGDIALIAIRCCWRLCKSAR